MTQDKRKSTSRRPKLRRVLMSAAVLLLSLLSISTAGAATDVCGPIMSDTTWTAAGGPYVATCSLLVMAGVKLTIEPNIEVRFNADLGLQVDGQLVARGTKDSPITFTKNGPGNWGYVWFTDSSVDATFDGGGDYVSGSIIEHAVIEYAGSVPTDGQSGALLLKDAFPFIHATTIRNNVASGIDAYDLATAKTLKLTDNTISGNAAASSGGGINIKVTTASEIVIAGSTITGNSAQSSNGWPGGGGIAAWGGTLTLSNNTISGNAVSGAGGGGIALFGAYVALTATITNNTVTGNTSTAIWGSARGGGINANNSSVVLTGNRVTGNSAAGFGDPYNSNPAYGGGICLVGGTAVLTNNSLRGNATTSNFGEGYGGGIYAESVSSGDFSNNLITQNRAQGAGGGLSMKNTAATLPLHNNSIIGNTAPTGSAVHYTGADGQDLTANLFFANVATTELTGATIFLAAGHPDITLNNIYDNTGAYELWNDNANGSGNVNAGQNWWDTTSTAEIMAKIYDYFDNAAKSVVDFSLFRTEPIPAVPVPPAVALGVYRTGTWYLDKNANGLWDGCGTDGCISWGGDAMDHVVLGDWNGSGTTKIGVYRTGTWYLDTNGNGLWDGCGTDACLSWGGDPSDVPVVGDWNGTGTAKIGVYRAATGTWYLDTNGNGTWDGCLTDGCLAWGGAAADQPIVGDWNNDGRTKIGVYRNGVWYLDKNGNGLWDGCATDQCLSWGGDASDKTILGDWNGSGTTKIGVYRTGTWYLDKNGNGLWDGCSTDTCLSWGGDPADTIVLGDWNGSGTMKIGVYRASTGTWYLDTNGNGVWDGCGTDGCISWGGNAGDQPIVGKW